MAASKRLYTPQLCEENVRRLHKEAKRFQMTMTKMLNLIVATALEELEQIDDPDEWEVAIPVREA
jgi:hypothetical protein